MRGLCLPVCLLVLAGLVACHPTVYMKRHAEDTLSPVLVPVSSTVVPLPIYKVGYSVGVGKKLYDPDVKLITLKTKHKTKFGAQVKRVSREDFEKDTL